MGMPADDEAVFLAPASDLAAPRGPQTLEDEAGLEVQNTTAMAVGARATIKVSSADGIYAVFRGATGLSNQVSNTDLQIGAGQTFSWYVTEETKFIYCQAVLGAGFQAVVWQSSHGLK